MQRCFPDPGFRTPLQVQRSPRSAEGEGDTARAEERGALGPKHPERGGANPRGRRDPDPRGGRWLEKEAAEGW